MGGVAGELAHVGGTIPVFFGVGVLHCLLELLVVVLLDVHKVVGSSESSCWGILFRNHSSIDKISINFLPIGILVFSFSIHMPVFELTCV